MKKPRLAITMGDPAGVGPEIVIRALADERVAGSCRPVVLGDRAVLDFVAGKLGLPPAPEETVRNLSDLDPAKITPGRAAEENGRAMIGYIEEAVRLCLSGGADAMVTGPITKEAARLAGFPYPGHTEFIAHLTGAGDYRMMLGGSDLKVVLVTIHVPLKEVPSLVTVESVYKTVRVTNDAFRRDFGMEDPRIAVCGLNPHAGEGGMFGSEEAEKIVPAIERARGEGMNVTGPLPADTVFYRAARKRDFDAVVAMYHDQGLGPLKLLHFEDGVNATLGLPIIRTSVDHGTAYDIAWKGVAGHESMVAAVEMAAGMAERRRKAG